MIIALFAVYPDLILENTTLMALPLYGYCNVRYYYSIYFGTYSCCYFPMPRA